MLHEILLSLSGHPSPLFDAPTSKTLKSPSFPLLSVPETELLSSVGHLSRLHRRTRDHAAQIASSHPSTVCRAVATAITSHHLAKFQQKILDVEARILRQDGDTVGAYNIVPLAGIVGEFSEWTRLMEWLWYISNFMLAADAASRSHGAVKADRNTASGAETIDKLRIEAQTGYPDLEEAAQHLGKVAESSWLRQLSTWVLYGRLPSFGAADFFIKSDADDDELSFVVEHQLVPKFVTRQTASSILFVGRSLNQIRALGTSSRTFTGRSSSTSELALLPEHVRHLSQVTAPISSSKLSGAIANIRLSLSRNLLQHLLPLEKIVEIVSVLYEFFLLGRGEFAMALITEADEKLNARHRDPAQSKPNQGIRGILLKEGEVNNALARVWSALSSLTSEYRSDDVLDLAADLVHLTVHTSTTTRPGTPGRARESIAKIPKITNVAFNDLLLSIPTSLVMDIRSPLDLFVTKSDLDLYSSINAYLVSLRRSHLHLAQLWRNSFIRREHPAPPGYQVSNTAFGKQLLRRRRQRNEARSREMRPVWATCAAAIFFLSESEAYFQGEVVQESFHHFRGWVTGPLSKGPEEQEDVRSTATLETSGQFQKSISQKRQHHDPETLALAHRLFLGSLSYSLLLTDLTFTRAIREFFTHVDELVAFVTRQQAIRQNLDLEEDEGIEDNLTNFKQEEKDVARELDRARRRLDGDLKSLVGRLRDIDSERVGSGLEFGKKEEGDFEPLRVGGVDRLLMKLDWGAKGEDDSDSE